MTVLGRDSAVSGGHRSGVPPRTSPTTAALPDCVSGRTCDLTHRTAPHPLGTTTGSRPAGVRRSTGIHRWVCPARPSQLAGRGPLPCVVGRPPVSYTHLTLP